LLRQTGLVRLDIGPVDRTTFDALAPGGAAHGRVRAVIDHVTGGLLDADMDIAIACGQEPRARLGAVYGSRLGSTALIARPRVDRPLSVRVRFGA
jgi:predicted component of type VI protein secretion system